MSDGLQTDFGCKRCGSTDSAAALTSGGTLARITPSSALEDLWDFADEDAEPHVPHCFECTVCGHSEAGNLDRVFEIVIG
jgi:transcription elongation factor Elf1